MTIFVLYHKERFLLDPMHPIWQHYDPFKWWLLPHGLAGAFALLLAPLQFSDRLRKRYTKMHRVIGRLYVTNIFLFAPIGLYIQYLDEAQGAARSFTIATVVFMVLLMTTTGFALFYAIKRMIPLHRQWMTRSYSVSIVFLEVRFFLGVTGWDQPFSSQQTETAVWICLALSILLGDIANQIYELRLTKTWIKT